MASLPSIPKLGPGALKAVALAIVGVFIIAAAWALWPGADTKTLNASFPRTASVYEGSDVRVLGVKIGQVETVTPSGTTVQVEMTYDSTVKVPEDAKAAIVAPSVVGDRYIQLTPVYQSGPVLEDGATLDINSTAVPLELDEIYQSLSDIAQGLGPEGANRDDALSRLLDSTARNFGGQGEQFNETIRNLSRFTSTLDSNKEALFSTVREIDRFVNALEENDTTVRNFNDSLAAASSVLEDEREELAASLRNLGVAMEAVSSFVRENREALSRNIRGLVRVSDILVKQRAALDETLRNAPVALGNLFHTYNPNTGTLDTRSNMGENLHALQEDPAITLCTPTNGAPNSGELCDEFENIFGRAAPGARPGSVSKDVVVIEPIDTTLAGILGEKR